MPYPRIISFYTPDWEYPAYAKKMRDDCMALGLSHSIQELPNTGSYLKNTCMKPNFIRFQLRTRNEPVLWVDVDGTILKKPEYLNGLIPPEIDFGARPITDKKRTRKWHVGTLYFRPTARAFDFLDAWCENTGSMTDESALDATWKSRKYPLNALELPREYFQLLPNAWAEAAPNTVIAHRISGGEQKQFEVRKAAEHERKYG